MKAEAVVIRVDKDMKAKLSKLAEVSKRTLSDYIRLVMESAIEKKLKL